jgi:hypothetical protein
MAPHSLVGRYHGLGGTCYLHLQGTGMMHVAGTFGTLVNIYHITEHHIPVDSNMQLYISYFSSFISLFPCFLPFLVFAFCIILSKQLSQRELEMNHVLTLQAMK